MQIIREIQLDLKNPAITLPVHAKQNDQLTRYIKAYLYDGGVPFEPPPGTLAMFRAKKPDGTECFYDTNEKGEPAIVIEGNTVTVELAHQVLTRAGKVDAEINLYTAQEERLTSFSFVVQVERSALPDEEILSSDYYNILAKQIAQTLDAAKDAEESAQEIKNLQETVSQTIQQEGAAQKEALNQVGESKLAELGQAGAGQLEGIQQSGAEPAQDTKGAQTACSKAAVRRQEGTLQKEGTGVMAGTLGQARLSEQSYDEEVEGLEQMLRQKAGQLLGVRKEIERAIGAVENDTYRLLLRYRYIQGDTFEKIAERMHYSSRQVMNLHSAALGACQILEGSKEIA